MPFLRKFISEVSWLSIAVWRRVKSRLFSIKRLIISPALPNNPDGRVCIHLGCGQIDSPEFINVDASHTSHIHYCRDVKDLSCFPDNSADLVYACHILEHIQQGELRKVLWEWKRILKADGILRISVPDFDKLINMYLSTSRDIGRIHAMLMGDHLNKYDIHHSIFNEHYLSTCLLEIGFREVRRWNPEQVAYHAFEDWSNKTHISLNLEGLK